MTNQELFEQIKKKSSYLCVGLDTDYDKLPRCLKGEKNPILTFNEAIIEATHDLCVAYKPNVAFYEAHGYKGWNALEETKEMIPRTHLSIADAKRGDIGNTTLQYGKAFFEHLDFDALTISPYMGIDAVKPFLAFKNKWTIILGLTSNEGAADFEMLKLNNGKFLYQQVLETAKGWGNEDNTMFVVGANQSSQLIDIRKIVPLHFLLVPGVGAQGGDLMNVAKYGMNKRCGLLVNASRSILFASAEKDFAAEARKQALKLKEKMTETLDLFL